MNIGKSLLGWQEILVSGVPSYARPLRVTVLQSQVWQHKQVIALVNGSWVRIYKAAARIENFTPRKDLLLLEIQDSDVNVETLQELFIPAAALLVIACRDSCHERMLERQKSWHFIVTTCRETVMGRDFSFRHNWRRLNRVAVILHRNGVSLHSRSLAEESPPQLTTRFKFLPAGATLSSDLSKLFPRQEAGEIAAVHRINRDELLNCLNGGAVNGSM